MEDVSILGPVSLRLATEDQFQDITDALSIIDELHDDSTPISLISWITIEDVDDLLEALTNREHIRSTEQKAVAFRERYESLSGLVLDGTAVSSEAFGPRFEAHLECLSLTAELGEIERAIELANVALRYIDQSRIGADPTVSVMLGELLWTAASALGSDEHFFSSLEYSATAADVLEDDHLLSTVVARCLQLYESGVAPQSELIQRASAALFAIVGPARYQPSTLQLRFRLAQIRADKVEMGVLCKVAAAREVFSSRQIKVAELIARLGSLHQWTDEFGPFAPYVYAETIDLSVEEAVEAFGGSAGINEEFTLSKLGESTRAAGFRAIRIGYVTFGEPLCAEPTAVLNQWIHEIEEVDDQITTAEGRRPVRRAVPTAAMHTVASLMRRPECPSGVSRALAIGRFVAENVTTDQIEAMLLFFEAGPESDSALACAGILCGIMQRKIGPASLPAYIDHLELAHNHSQAMERLNSRVGFIGRSTIEHD